MQESADISTAQADNSADVVTCEGLNGNSMVVEGNIRKSAMEHDKQKPKPTQHELYGYMHGAQRLAMHF